MAEDHRRFSSAIVRPVAARKSLREGAQGLSIFLLLMFDSNWSSDILQDGFPIYHALERDLTRTGQATQREAPSLAVCPGFFQPGEPTRVHRELFKLTKKCNKSIHAVVEMSWMRPKRVSRENRPTAQSY